MKRAVVLGAGPAGLSAAYHLAQNGYRVDVVERAPRVGGLGGSYRWSDFILDYGPHAFHVKDSPTMDIVKDLFSDTPDDLIYQDRDELLYLHRKYFHYPMQFYELMRRMNPFHSARLVFGFLMSSAIYRYIAVPDDTFESWCIKRFGKPLYQLIFGIYTGKVWGMPPSKISAKFAARKIHRLNLKDIILKLLGGKGEEQETYWKDLAYPRLGSGQMFEKLADRITAGGNTIHLNSEPQAINTYDGRVKSVEISTDGETSEIECDAVVSSIPLKYLAGAIKPQLGDFYMYSLKLLRYRSLIVVHVAFDQEQVLPVHWIYLVDKEFKFNRLTEQKNMSAATAVPARSVVSAERGCYFGDELWSSPDEKLFDMARDELARMPDVDISRISSFHVVRMKDAYPVYDLEFDRNLKALLTGLSGINNLYSFGRQGMFLQTDMHDSMENGRILVERLVSGVSSQEWYDEMLAYWKLSDEHSLV
jgi:protoporphyrinogen oxidase